MKTDNRILQLYVYKRLEGRLKLMIETVKTELSQKLIPATWDGSNVETVDESGLKVKFSQRAGRKSFDESKAKKVLLKKLGDEQFNAVFSEYLITKLPGAEPPKEFMKEMKKYFAVERRDKIEEAFATTYPGVTEKDREKMYTRTASSVTMYTPTTMSDNELFGIVKKKSLDVTKLLLEEG